MSRDPTTLPDDTARAAALPRDWFLPAIESDAGVGGCLDAVIDELTSRAQFVHQIRQNLDQKLPGGSDTITSLSQKLRSLENTLRFRLGILRPERPQAWFRAPAVTTTGPFSSSVINEPVFCAYDPAEIDKLQAELKRCWETSSNKVYTFQDSGSCLWRTLLALKWEHELICRLKAPFEDLRLDVLPDHLPAKFESRALRAFLLNVRTEILAIRTRLDACFQQLTECSVRFWDYQKKHMPETEPAYARRGQTNQAADSVREELRRRRAQQAQFLTPGDINALKFMGFREMPNPSELRQRYIELAKKLHPDRFGGEDQSFKQLSHSYNHLLERLGA
jgi:hypothetical protein